METPQRKLRRLPRDDPMTGEKVARPRQSGLLRSEVTESGKATDLEKPPKLLESNLASKQSKESKEETAEMEEVRLKLASCSEGFLEFEMDGKTYRVLDEAALTHIAGSCDKQPKGDVGISRPRKTLAQFKAEFRARRS